MASLNEILARARTIAESRARDANTSPIIDSGMAAEALVPHAIRHVISKASNEDLRQTTADHEIEIDANSEGTLPESVIREFLDESSFLPRIARSSYVPWPDYHRPRFDNLLCYYTQRNGVFKSDCEAYYGELIKTISLADKNEDSDLVTIDAGTKATGRLTVNAPNTYARGSLTMSGAAVKSTGVLTVHGAQATGTLQVYANIQEGETIDVNGAPFMFSNTQTESEAPGAPEIILFTNNAATDAENLRAALAASTNTALTNATYTRSGSVVTITYDDIGTAGNTYTLEDSVLPPGGGRGAPSVVASGSTLTGGEVGPTDGETLEVNGVTFTFYASGTVPDGATNPIEFVASPASNATAIAAALNASVDASISIATYTASGATVSIQYDTFGPTGNTFLIEDSSLDAVTASGPTLTGGQNGITEGETLAVNGATVTFRNTNPGTDDVSYGPSAAQNAIFLAGALNGSANGSINDATYSADGVTVQIVHDTAGAGGNSFTLANSSGGSVTRSAATLLGGGESGVTEGESIAVNGVTFTFSNILFGIYNVAFDNDDPEITAANLAIKLANTAHASLVVATYESDDADVVIEYRTSGTDGNAFTLANSSDDSVTRSGATLTGGLDGSAGGEFIALEDSGRRLVLVEGSEAEETVNAIIQERLSPSQVRLRDYHTGEYATEVIDGTARIYEPQLELVRTIAVGKTSGDAVIIADTGLGGGTDADIGRLVTVTIENESMAGVETVIRAVIVDVANEDAFVIGGYELVSIASFQGTANIYHILDPTITLNAPTVPSVPTDADDDIDLPTKMIEDVILVVAMALTGEMPLEQLLGAMRTEAE